VATQPQVCNKTQCMYSADCSREVMCVQFLVHLVGCHDAAVRERAFRYLQQLRLSIVLESTRRSFIHRVDDELPKRRATWSGNYVPVTHSTCLCLCSSLFLSVSLSVFSVALSIRC